MGRYVVAGLALALLPLVVDSADGRLFGRSRSPRPVCCTCPMPSCYYVSDWCSACASPPLIAIDPCFETLVPVVSDCGPVAPPVVLNPCGSLWSEQAASVAPPSVEVLVAPIVLDEPPAIELRAFEPKPVEPENFEPLTKKRDSRATDNKEQVEPTPLDDNVANDDVANDDVANDDVANDDVANDDVANDDRADDALANDHSLGEESAARRGAEGVDAAVAEPAAAVFPAAAKPLPPAPMPVVPIPTPAPAAAARSAESSDDADGDRYARPAPTVRESPPVDLPAARSSTAGRSTEPDVDLEELFAPPADPIQLDRTLPVKPDASARAPSDRPPQLPIGAPAEVAPKEDDAKEDDAKEDDANGDDAEDKSGEQGDEGEVSDKDLFGGDAKRELTQPGGLASDGLRRWSDITGLYGCTARLVSVGEKRATLRFAGGATGEVELSRLSTADLAFVRAQIAAKLAEVSREGAALRLAVEQNR